jgi:hypothetical protein
VISRSRIDVDSSCTRRADTRDNRRCIRLSGRGLGDGSGDPGERYSSRCKLCLCSTLIRSILGLLDPLLMYFRLQSNDWSPSSVSIRIMAINDSAWAGTGPSNFLHENVTAFFGSVFPSTLSLRASDDELPSVMIRRNGRCENCNKCDAMVSAFEPVL